jgi:hypothetical protein
MAARPTTRRSIAVAAAVNNAGVLENCLRRSPDVKSGALVLRTYEGFRSAGAAYNRALAEADVDVVVLVHQDVYLPRGFAGGLAAELDRLDATDPDWAIAGVMGLDASGVLHGRTWSSGIGALIGSRPDAPVPVETTDEMLLIVRRASGVTFDERLPGFHLYATDAIQTAKAGGRRSYVIDAPAVHHSRAVVDLDASYRMAYRYMQRKWRAQLPIPNLVCPITRSPFALWVRNARIRRKHYGRPRPPEPTDDPSVIARRIGFEAAEP